MWTKFDADQPDPKIEKMILEERNKLYAKLLIKYGKSGISIAKERTIANYESGLADALNR